MLQRFLVINELTNFQLRRFAATAMVCVALLRRDIVRLRNAGVAYNALICCDDATQRDATH